MIRPILILLVSAIGLCAEETNLKPDEQIIFYPSIAQRVKGETNLWRATIRGNVFEPERRRLTVAVFREAVELNSREMTGAEEATFDRRARLFLVDHERDKKVFVRLGTNEFFVGKSGADGRFAGEITFHDEDLERRSPIRRDGEPMEHAGPEAGAPFKFTAVLRPDDTRTFSGTLFPLEAEGVSIISDIDDTIKITEVRDKEATVRNTFLREFQPVPGMAEFYQALARRPLTPSLSPSDAERVAEGRVRGGLAGSGISTSNITFHYISASPWQLYEPLDGFVRSNHFPAGLFELKQFRWKDRSFLSLFANPEKYKPGVIEPLLKQFPKRSFILVGDSGERDPEIYGALARKFPDQILRILIRDVTGETAEAARYQKAFRDVPVEKWQIFREPDEIK